MSPVGSMSSNPVRSLLVGLFMAANLGTLASARERISINSEWKFERFTENPDALSYDALKQWILPAANDFIVDGTQHERPSAAAPGANVTFVQDGFDDSTWETVNLPHDWAISGTFDAPGVGGGMGRLPSNGIGWYRRELSIPEEDIKSGKQLYLDVDGAMSYAAVWLNGNLVGGWPYGYASFRLDLTPYANAGDNLLAIRLDNALENSRWYPGAGIYRNVWLVKTEPVHVGHWGTHVTTPTVSGSSATVNIVVDVENSKNSSETIEVSTEIFELDSASGKARGAAVASFPKTTVTVGGRSKQSVEESATVSNPALWGPPPTQKPNRYVAVTTLSSNGSKAIDTYESPFGIRTLEYSGDGFLINGEKVYVKGTCNHHDLGSLGAAFNYRAQERQVEILQEMGTNALRTSHNVPAPEFLEIADRLGMLVMDEIFDTWNRAKTTNDFHLIFPDWHEPDLRAFVRRDRNHPSIISWSIGNELWEQSDAEGGQTGGALQTIAHEEDPTRQVTVGKNNAGPGTPLTDVIDIIGLNYQGEGKGNSWFSTFPGFHSRYPNKMIWSTESASTVSSRGVYIFPVTSNKSAVVGGPDAGGDPVNRHVSAYELYSPSWAASPDKVFEQQDRHPYVAGEFVWTGWDYIGEPTPYDESRSSYFGIIDLAGFKKDRFYLYQSRWRSELPVAHILPHWTWPDRVNLTTPVHVFTSGDEAELFVNGKSAGRKTKGEFDYRLRWDNVTYQPGEVRVVAYKNGEEWATDSKRTVGDAAKLNITADRTSIAGDGADLSFVSIAVVDEKGDVVPEANNKVTFEVEGPGEIVSTDNGDPTDTNPFPSKSRNAFSGLALAIVRATGPGEIVVKATADGLVGADVAVQAS
ncbi:glycoside hydrolase family 2 protein [Corynespora cassiicola Philippines]|uniref:Glycoside hydrolase family 2 protein n=1 Tax=Corynespora cassiicola Philippines TaxID=1448308 RepID=A0A2T2NE21_CORCC|nr:glycoside hydrolase family 2 protein [Corynespora cassiicola Philippines]